MALTKKQREAIARAVLATARGLDDVPELDMAALSEMSTDDLFNYADAHGAVLDRDQVASLVREQLGADLDALARGVQFDDAKQAKFRKDIQSGVQAQARLVAKQAMGAFREQVINDADERPDYERFSVWIAKLRKSCRSCEALHGEVKSEAQWDDIGRPRSGNTLCGANCECDLVPVAVTRDATRNRIDEINRQGPRRSLFAA